MGVIDPPTLWEFTWMAWEFACDFALVAWDLEFSLVSNRMTMITARMYSVYSIAYPIASSHCNTLVCSVFSFINMFLPMIDYFVFGFESPDPIYLG